LSAKAKLIDLIEEKVGEILLPFYIVVPTFLLHCGEISLLQRSN